MEALKSFVTGIVVRGIHAGIARRVRSITPLSVASCPSEWTYGWLRIEVHRMQSLYSAKILLKDQKELTLVGDFTDIEEWPSLATDTLEKLPWEEVVCSYSTEASARAQDLENYLQWSTNFDTTVEFSLSRRNRRDHWELDRIEWFQFQPNSLSEQCQNLACQAFRHYLEFLMMYGQSPAELFIGALEYSSPSQLVELGNMVAEYDQAFENSSRPEVAKQYLFAWINTHRRSPAPLNVLDNIVDRALGSGVS